MIRIAVYDDEQSSILRLDAAFEYYAVNRNTEYDVSWFVGSEGLKRIEKYACDFHIALVSVGSKGSGDFCIKLNEKNPDCRICYYNACDRSSADISNPLWFMDGDSSEIRYNQATAEKIDQLFNGFRYFGNLLMFDTRQLLYIIPVEEVVYFQSDLKYVNIICQSKDSISIYKKLDEVEASLSKVFLRIHKSYIVNRTYIKRVDKTNRIVVLENGEELPISNSQYVKVMEELSPKI